MSYQVASVFNSVQTVEQTTEEKQQYRAKYTFGSDNSLVTNYKREVWQNDYLTNSKSTSFSRKDLYLQRYYSCNLGNLKDAESLSDEDYQKIPPLLRYFNYKFSSLVDLWNERKICKEKYITDLKLMGEFLAQALELPENKLILRSLQFSKNSTPYSVISQMTFFRYQDEEGIIAEHLDRANLLDKLRTVSGEADRERGTVTGRIKKRCQDVFVRIQGNEKISSNEAASSDESRYMAAMDFVALDVKNLPREGAGVRSLDVLDLSCSIKTPEEAKFQDTTAHHLIPLIANSQMKGLNLDGHRCGEDVVSTVLVKALRANPSITSLSLKNNRLTGESLAKIAEISTLEELDISDNKLLTTDDLRVLEGLFSYGNLKMLRMNNCPSARGLVESWRQTNPRMEIEMKFDTSKIEETSRNAAMNKAAIAKKVGEELMNNVGKKVEDLDASSIQLLTSQEEEGKTTPLIKSLSKEFVELTSSFKGTLSKASSSIGRLSPKPSLTKIFAPSPSLVPLAQNEE